jgi:hypothetical protein
MIRRCDMTKVKEMTVEDIEQLIEHKLLEIIGDPDSGLHLKKEFKTKLEQRLKNPQKEFPTKR